MSVPEDCTCTWRPTAWARGIIGAPRSRTWIRVQVDENCTADHPINGFNEMEVPG